MSDTRSAGRPAAAPSRQKPPDPEGIVFVDASWDVPQAYAADPLIGRLFEAFKRKRLVGARVPGSGRVIFPPQSVCEVSYREADELVEVGPGGTVRTFTVVHSKFGGAPPTPYVMVFVQLDGASTASGGYLRNVDIGTAVNLALIGKRVRAVFKEEPAGQWSDVWFELEG
jgi:uncharacterized protein